MINYPSKRHHVGCYEHRFFEERWKFYLVRNSVDRFGDRSGHRSAGNGYQHSGQVLEQQG
jgi:hypothetical protein